MPRNALGLSAAKVKSAAPGRYADGRGLYLYVKAGDSKFWIFRYMRQGKAHCLGLGPASGKHPISLLQAREAAYKLVDQLRAGIDPAQERTDAKAAKKAEAAVKTVAGITFKEVAGKLLAQKEKGWKNPIHKNQWRSTLDTYVYPIIGDWSVADVDTGAVTRILEPIWTTKTETASRIRGRIENILDFAKTMGWRKDENPARWSNLKFVLAKPADVAPVVHLESLPWRQIGDFMIKLREKHATSAKALEFTILTAARSGEVRKATWDEIDFAAKTWTVPGARMKMKKSHKVPLSEQAIKVLNEMKEKKNPEQGNYIFPSRTTGSFLSDVSLTKMLQTVGGGDATVHGFRSTFRDWVAEVTHFQREVAEAALAHMVGGVEGAYQRGDLFEKRRVMMAAWAAYLDQPTVKDETDNVVTMHKVA